MKHSFLLRITDTNRTNTNLQQLERAILAITHAITLTIEMGVRMHYSPLLYPSLIAFLKALASSSERCNSM
jgi:hypothetical protein